MKYLSRCSEIISLFATSPTSHLTLWLLLYLLSLKQFPTYSRSSKDISRKKYRTEETTVATRNYVIQQIFESLGGLKLWTHNQKVQFLCMSKQMNLLPCITQDNLKLDLEIILHSSFHFIPT